MRLERPTALCATSPSPNTCITTVSTIKSRPHAQSALQLPGTTTTILNTPWATPIGPSIARSLDCEFKLTVDGSEVPRPAHSIVRHDVELSSQINIHGCAELPESPGIVITPRLPESGTRGVTATPPS